MMVVSCSCSEETPISDPVDLRLVKSDLFQESPYTIGTDPNGEYHRNGYTFKFLEEMFQPFPERQEYIDRIFLEVFPILDTLSVPEDFKSRFVIEFGFNPDPITNIPPVYTWSAIQVSEDGEYFYYDILIRYHRGLPSQRNLLHELGHAWDFANVNAQQDPAILQLYEQTKDLYRNAHNVKEWFAEVFRLYWQDPKGLRLMDPEAFELVSGFLNK